MSARAAPSTTWDRLARGLAVGGLPGVLLVGWALLYNPWFLDRPLLAALLLVLLPALGVAGLWRRGAAAVWRARGLAVGVLGLGVWLWPAPGPQSLRMLVVVWDGATWSRIDALQARGELQALGALRAQGVSTTLVSMEPMFSPLLWTTMATGKPPAEHGVRGFRTRSTDVKVPRFWDVAEAEGLRVGVYKWLVTYPPRSVDGFIVPDWLAPAPETWPEELRFAKELELKNRLQRRRLEGGRPTWRLALEGIPRGLRFGTVLAAGGWKLREALLRPGPEERTVALQLLRGRIDRDVFVHALHTYTPDLATFGYYATDALGHPFWSDALPGEPGAPPHADVLPSAYRQADAILAELLERVGPECVVVVMSDHGFRAADASRDRVRVHPLTERLRARLRAAGLEADVARLGWKLTVTVPPEQEAQARAAVEALADAAGQPFYRVEAVAPGALGLSLLDEALDAERLASDTVGGEPIADYVQAGEPYAGEHDAAGIFVVRAPGVPPGVLPGAGLLDVAPTLLALLGIPPAQDLPGAVLVGPTERGPASRDGLAGQLRVLEGVEGVDEEALRAIGYIE